MNPVLVSATEDMKNMKFYEDIDDVYPEDFDNFNTVVVTILPTNFNLLDESTIVNRGKNYTTGKIKLNKEEETVEFEVPALTFHLLNDGDPVDLDDVDTFYYWDGEWVLSDKIGEEIEDDLYEELNPNED